VHYMMGGVHTDIHGATPLDGLYAAGEVACVSINGANRLGSNSLPELLVFGARAGSAAAEYASTADEPAPVVLAQAEDERRRLERELFATDGREPIANLRTELQDTMEASAGIYRSADSLVKGMDTLGELRARCGSIAMQDHSRTFNTELVAALELANLLDVAETMLHSAERRQESRGAHQRTDFPARDDEHYLAHSLANRDPDGSCRVEYTPVTITRWPPGERVYGR
jgi:fumarate reductase flavoprotein subunit